jgi:7-cyano-7-deazaguanine synthase
MSHVIVLSGGLDSTILTYKVKHENPSDDVFALSFNYGQRHSRELEGAVVTCQKLGIPHKVIDISFLGDIVAPVSALSAHKQVEMPTIKDIIGHPQPVSYVPFRNMILTSLALSFAESVKAQNVYLGIQVHDEYAYWDTNSKFVRAMQDVADLNRMNTIQIRAPFVNMSKKEEIELGITLGVPFEDTWTCYTGGQKACGTCPSCSERIMNFAKAGIVDPVPYEIDIDWQKLIAKVA